MNSPLHVVSQSDDDPPFEIDPNAITHAFAALTIADRVHSDALGDQIARLNHHCQPAVWDVQFNAKFTLYAAEPGNDGYPSPSSVPSALQSVGLVQPASIYIHFLQVGVGKPGNVKVLAGFAVRDENPRIVFARIGGCKPRSASISLPELKLLDDRAIAQCVREGRSFGSEIDALFAELVTIGEREGYLVDGPNNTNIKDARTQEIGHHLAAIGGKALMEAAYYRVEILCGNRLANHLSATWNRIGGWMS